MTENLSEFEWVLAEIAQGVGVRLQVGGSSDLESEILGSPPARARLHRSPDGSVTVRVPLLSEPSDVETVLHELAHFHFGLRETYGEEARCFEWAAVQALRLPVTVSTEVARMAKEALT